MMRFTMTWPGGVCFAEADKRTESVALQGSIPPGVNSGEKHHAQTWRAVVGSVVGFDNMEVEQSGDWLLPNDPKECYEPENAVS